jgi:hypothetical protein
MQGNDCVDTDPEINPGAYEDCDDEDREDENCNDQAN